MVYRGHYMPFIQATRRVSDEGWYPPRYLALCKRRWNPRAAGRWFHNTACRHRGEVGLVVVRSSDVTGAQKQDVGAGARPGGRQSRSFSYGLQNERERDKVRRQSKNRNWKWTER